MSAIADVRRRGGAAGLCVGAALASVLLMPAPSGASPGAVPGTQTVIIEGLKYRPAELTIARGERVTWINEDLVPHTVTATDGAFDSKRIDPGASWSYVARKTGNFPYTCRYHPAMKGRITVR